jgi:hypothetical protein
MYYGRQADAARPPSFEGRAGGRADGRQAAPALMAVDTCTNTTATTDQPTVPFPFSSLRRPPRPRQADDGLQQKKYTVAAQSCVCYRRSTSKASGHIHIPTISTRTHSQIAPPKRSARKTALPQDRAVLAYAVAALGFFFFF